MRFEPSPREASYQRKLARVSEILGLTDNQMQLAGISKMKAICQLYDYKVELTPELKIEMTRLVNDAPNSYLADIKVAVKKLKGIETPESIVTWVKIPVFKGSEELVMRAIELAKVMSDDYVLCPTKEAEAIATATAMERICNDFLSDPNHEIEAEELILADDYYEGLEIQ